MSGRGSAECPAQRGTESTYFPDSRRAGRRAAGPRNKRLQSATSLAEPTRLPLAIDAFRWDLTLRRASSGFDADSPLVVQRLQPDKMTDSTVADTRRLNSKPQDLTDAYGPPSNFLEIDVFDPQIVGVGRTRYTTYEVRMRVSVWNRTHHVAALATRVVLIEANWFIAQSLLALACLPAALMSTHGAGCDAGDGRTEAVPGGAHGELEERGFFAA